ncbi:hypothetical protein KUV63_12690 [Epibacterium mobile]|nr:hypothetical protein [Tritonibacter mobilis]
MGSSFPEIERTDEEIAAYADAMADMFCAYLVSLSNHAGNGGDRPASSVSRTGR